MVHFIVSLTGLKNVQTMGKTLFLDLFVRMSPEKINYHLNLWAGKITLTSAGGHHLIPSGPE